MDVLRKIDEIWANVEKGILSITTIAMSIMLIGNALSRYLLNKSWGFTEEIGQLAVIVMTFMGLGYAARKGTHIEMSGFFDLLPEKYQRYLKVIITFFTAIIMLICTYFGFKYVHHLFVIGEVTTILRLPVYTVMIVVPIGFFLAFARYVTNFFIILKNGLQ